MCITRKRGRVRGILVWSGFADYGWVASGVGVGDGVRDDAFVRARRMSC